MCESVQAKAFVGFHCPDDIPGPFINRETDILFFLQGDEQVYGKNGEALAMQGAFGGLIALNWQIKAFKDEYTGKFAVTHEDWYNEVEDYEDLENLMTCLDGSFSKVYIVVAQNPEDHKGEDLVLIDPRKELTELLRKDLPEWLEEYWGLEPKQLTWKSLAEHEYEMVQEAIDERTAERQEYLDSNLNPWHLELALQVFYMKLTDSDGGLPTAKALRNFGRLRDLSIRVSTRISVSKRSSPVRSFFLIPHNRYIYTRTRSNS